MALGAAAGLLAACAPTDASSQWKGFWTLADAGSPDLPPRSRMVQVSSSSLWLYSPCGLARFAYRSDGDRMALQPPDWRPRSCTPQERAFDVRLERAFRDAKAVEVDVSRMRVKGRTEMVLLRAP